MEPIRYFSNPNCAHSSYCSHCYDYEHRDKLLCTIDEISMRICEDCIYNLIYDSDIVIDINDAYNIGYLIGIIMVIERTSSMINKDTRFIDVSTKIESDTKTMKYLVITNFENIEQIIKQNITNMDNTMFECMPIIDEYYRKNYITNRYNVLSNNFTKDIRSDLTINYEKIHKTENRLLMRRRFACKNVHNLSDNIKELCTKLAYNRDAEESVKFITRGKYHKRRIKLHQDIINNNIIDIYNLFNNINGNACVNSINEGSKVSGSKVNGSNKVNGNKVSSSKVNGINSTNNSVNSNNAFEISRILSQIISTNDRVQFLQCAFYLTLQYYDQRFTFFFSSCNPISNNKSNVCDCCSDCNDTGFYDDYDFNRYKVRRSNNHDKDDKQFNIDIKSIGNKVGKLIFNEINNTLISHWK